MIDDLAPLSPAYVSDVLSKPPFIRIAGVINARDLGSYRSSTYPGFITRPNYLYRSADLSRITKEGELQLKALGISKVFDLRSDVEILKYNSQQSAIDGVETARTPVFQEEDYSPETMAMRYQLYASGKTEAFMELYSQIMDQGGPSFGAILRHVRDHPTKPCLFHCTAGKDRTGIMAAILLKLAGVSDENIANEYALSRVGREPARDIIMARLSQEPLFASNNEAALNMFTCRHETMVAFLVYVEEHYGDMEGYTTRILGLSGEDIQVIRDHILVRTELS